MSLLCILLAIMAPAIIHICQPKGLVVSLGDFVDKLYCGYSHTSPFVCYVNIPSQHCSASVCAGDIALMLEIVCTVLHNMP